MIVPKIIVCLAALTTLASALPSPHRAVAVDSHVAAMTDDVIQAIASHDYTTARTLYDVIKQSGHLDACAFQLASSMKSAMLSAEFQQLSLESKAEFEDLKEQLPISVKNIVFATSVCIHNLNFNEYLYSPNDDYIHDAQRRNVFLWRLGGSSLFGMNWTVEATASPNSWKIVNIYGEYLFADTTHYYLNRREVFTYMPSEWTGSTANVWRFEPFGDAVILQNVWYGSESWTIEYLYASSNVYNFDANRRRVFEWDAYWGTDMTHIWRFEAC